VVSVTDPYGRILGFLDRNEEPQSTINNINVNIKIMIWVFVRILNYMYYVFNFLVHTIM
jgi:hypothetical protein